MALTDFVDALPEDKREAYKAEIASAVQIKDRETVARLFKEHKEVKAEFDAEISRMALKHEEKFRAEKLPGLVDEEVRKRNPPKDEREKALEEMKAQLANMQREALLKDRRVTALQKLTEAGVPADFADFALDEDESVFNAKIEKLTGLKAWSDGLVKKALGEKLGNQKPGKTGEGTKSITLEEFNNLPAKARAEFMAKGGSIE